MAGPVGKYDRIKLSELKKRAQAGLLSKKELTSYFELDETKTTAFKPVLRMNRELVDIDGNRPSQREIAELYDCATRKAKERSRRKQGAAKPESSNLAASTKKVAIRVVAEGDSWFNLPDLLFSYPKDAIDFLGVTFDVARLALWMDTLQNMFAEKQYLQKLRSGNFRHCLFSGGGNDVLGSIQKYVERRAPGDTNPENAHRYVNSKFEKKVSDLISLYRKIADEIESEVDVPVVMYVHGYANVIPIPNGKNIGRVLRELDFDPANHPEMAAAVVKHMVKIFNDKLSAFASSRANVVYVDLRTAMAGAADWHTDEIHPSAAGARKVAAALGAAIRANTPSG